MRVKTKSKDVLSDRVLVVSPNMAGPPVELLDVTPGGLQTHQNSAEILQEQDNVRLDSRAVLHMLL